MTDKQGRVQASIQRVGRSPEIEWRRPPRARMIKLIAALPTTAKEAVKHHNQKYQVSTSETTYYVKYFVIA